MKPLIAFLLFSAACLAQTSGLGSGCPSGVLSSLGCSTTLPSGLTIGALAGPLQVANASGYAGLAGEVGNTTVPASLPLNSTGWLGANATPFTSFFFQPTSTSPTAAGPMLVGAGVSVNSGAAYVVPVTFGGISGTGTVFPTTTSPTFTGTVTMPTASICDNSTKAATTAYVAINCNVVSASGSPYNAPAQSASFWNATAGAFVVKLPTTASGIVVCQGNYKLVAQAISFVPATGSTIYYKGAAGTTSSSTGLVSGGAAGDYICLEAVDTTTWEALGAGYGSWTNH